MNKKSNPGPGMKPGMAPGKSPMKVFKRMAGYILHYYKWPCLLVVFMIFFSAMAQITGNMFLQSLIDDYISPLVGQPEIGRAHV